jgi:hypothetical protein
MFKADLNLLPRISGSIPRESGERSDIFGMLAFAGASSF